MRLHFHWRLAAIVALISLAIVRFACVASATRVVREGFSDVDATQTVTQIDQRFDENALVIIEVGPDGKPGRAGIDDGANGTTDEPGELGATGSDDICRVVFGDEADSAQSDPWVLVLQRGEFRPVIEGESIADDVRRRSRIRRVLANGRVRELLIDGP